MISGSLSFQDLLKLILEKAQKIKVYHQMAWHAEDNSWHRWSNHLIKIIHEGTSSEQPPVMEHDIEELADSDGDSESESNMTTGALHENHNGLHWLDGPPQNLVNVEQHAFTIEDTMNINLSYLLDLLNSTSATAWGQPIHWAPVPPSICAAPKEMDWNIW